MGEDRRGDSGRPALPRRAADRRASAMKRADGACTPPANVLGISLRLDLPTGRVGPGKIALLEAIAREGSISAAGRALGMSYRRAWILVEGLKAVLGQPAVETATGGSGGGGAALTSAGQALIDDYRSIERAAGDVAAARLEALARRVTAPVR